MTQRHPVQNQHVFFITTNCKYRESIFTNPAYANEAVLGIYKAQQIHPFLLFGFVIMPDHCHLLMNPPEYKSVSKIMHTFKRAVSFGIGKGSIWQSRFYIVYPKNPGAALQYIHMNPVKAGLSDAMHSYPWSSASGKFDVTPLPYL